MLQLLIFQETARVVTQKTPLRIFYKTYRRFLSCSSIRFSRLFLLKLKTLQYLILHYFYLSVQYHSAFRNRIYSNRNNSYIALRTICVTSDNVIFKIIKGYDNYSNFLRRLNTSFSFATFPLFFH